MKKREKVGNKNEPCTVLNDRYPKNSHSSDIIKKNDWIGCDTKVRWNIQDDENGGVLLIVLFFLSMSFALAVGFAFLVRSERSILESSLHRKRSQLFAESALHQAIGVVRSTYDPTDGTDDIHDWYPATAPGKNFYFPSDGPFAGRHYWCSTSPDNNKVASTLAISMGNYAFVPNAVLDVSDPQYPIEEDRGFIAIVDKGVLLGRFAFMIIDESGKLDPNGVTFSGGGNESSGSSERPGISPAEINLEDASLEDFTSYVISENERWFSMRQIARKLDPSDFETKVVQVVHPYSRNKNQYWNDDNNDSIVQYGEIYDRLDIRSSKEMSLHNLYKAFVAQNAPESEVSGVGDLEDDNNCAWLKQLHKDGIISTNTEQRLVAAQVAVNIKDYIDEDDEGTVAWVTKSGKLSVTDPGPGNSEIKIYGRENQYGLSELSAKISTFVIGTGEDAELQISVYFRGELFFPENEDFSLDSHQLSVNFSLIVESALGVNELFFDNTSFQIDLDSTVNEFGGTLWYSSEWGHAGTETRDGVFDDVSNEFQISNFQIDSCVLNNGTHDIDIFPSQPGHDYWWNWQSSDLTGANNLYVTLEAYDPLNNSQDENGPETTFHSLWRINPAEGAMLTNVDSAGIGQLTLLDDGSGVSLSEYGQVSVKNEPFGRVGEIGRVGSYWPGRSIRLWAANLDDELGTDTFLLDLFKGNDDEERKGCVNVNSMNTDVLEALLANTTSIGVNNSVNAILEKRNTETFRNIGDFFRISGISGSDKTADLQEEEMVIKLTELITVRQNYFTIVVAAQSIKDIGNQIFYKDLNNDGDSYDSGETIETKFGQYDPHADQILSTTKILAVFYRDVFTNEFTVEHIEYLK